MPDHESSNQSVFNYRNSQQEKKNQLCGGGCIFGIKWGFFCVRTEYEGKTHMELNIFNKFVEYCSTVTKMFEPKFSQEKFN